MKIEKPFAWFFFGLCFGLMVQNVFRKRLWEDRVDVTDKRRQEDSTESKTSYPRVLKTAT